ncbi:MAG: hypothetical protein EOO46_06775 [Flavobacterium sp.]|nr:MAG: hypothetical protein EOO46_06775 [Flavobacterium sp.]
MSLVNTFPEVQLFFKSDKFSQEELLSFIKEIEGKYKDAQLRKSVSTLISLKILQFQISHEEMPRKKNIIDKATKLTLEPEKEKKLHPLLSSLRHNSIENISINLQWSFSRISNLLKQKGISKSAENLLDSNEFKLVSEMFNSRLWGIERMERTKNPRQMIKKDKPKSLGNQISVYSKIEAIGMGKVIYIRKK